MTSPSHPPFQLSSSDPDAVLLNGLAELTALVRQTTEEIKESCEATEERRRKSQKRDATKRSDESTGEQPSVSESSEDSSLLEVIRDEVKELVEVVEELREDPEAARMKSGNAYLRSQVEYLMQQNQSDLLTTTQDVLQTLRDEQRSHHAELMRVLYDKKATRK